MSAIAGIYHLNMEPIPIEHSKLMMSAFAKFPSDNIELLHQDNLFFGCHAQWITPESVGEKLPYSDYNCQLTITADAIIDNRNEVFNKLQIENKDRSTISDSRLILLAYQKWGEKVINQIVGDYAFFIWDAKNQILFGARDFSGSRTLYFHEKHQKFVFSTTISSILQLPFVDKKLNEQWVAEFLAIPDMFNTVSLTSTVYKGIQQLPPSHTIRVSSDGVILSRFNAIDAKSQTIYKTNEEYEEAFKELYNQTINEQIRTISNVGAHLSGGLDSGSIVSYAANRLKTENKPLYTFSYIPADGFNDWTPRGRVADERPYIKSTVEHVGNIRDHYLKFNDRNPFSVIDDWLETIEMPYKFFENSYWMSGIYEEANRSKVSLLLNGSKGNYTVSWGAAFDYYAVLFKKLKWVHLYNEIQSYHLFRGLGRKRIIEKVINKAVRKSSNINNSFPSVINPTLAKQTKVLEVLEQNNIDFTGSSISNTYEARNNQFHKLYHRGNGHTLTNFSLRYKLWNRDPTNDLRIVRFCLSLPDSQFVQNGIDRSLIRRSTKGLLPDKVRMNYQHRGAQGADGIYRMSNVWDSFLTDLHEMIESPLLAEFLHIPTLKKVISKYKENEEPALIFDPSFKMTMRCLILYKFIKKKF
ncbi:asparagine synthase-related protein [Guptibacillus hwajinpoensis]|uniref:asparagine synthase-related protein n=1 Tax=Guptibacillus hwajinpoensis TaxID=208199 RepID=UPI001CFCE432|nr:asparagine synthase-related protein [Pseudalkalibacillus hwajinpoensis]